MYGFSPDLDLKEDDLRKQGRSLKVGLWSFLFTRSPEDDRQFFDLYEEHINRTAGEDWHCIGFAKKDSPVDAQDRGWRADADLHDTSNQLRAVVIDELISPWDSAIVFFNPFSFDQNGSGVVVRLDANLLANEDLFRRGLDVITQSVRESRGAGLENMRKDAEIDERLRRLRGILMMNQLRNVGRVAFGPIGRQLLGAILKAF